jgi:hypothetical protein
MPFNDEDALRALVREAVARHLQDPHDRSDRRSSDPRDPSNPRDPRFHASHYRYVLPESDGPCLIEPAVQCNHCGYCQSHGH